MAKEIPSDIQIVPAQPRWVKALHRGLDSVAREKEFLLSAQAPSLERLEKFVARMQEAENPQFVAVRGDEVVGWSDIRRFEQPALSHAGELGMGVIAACRGTGLGERLLRTCVEAAWARGFLKINLTVFASNAAAIALYKKLGFRQDGVLRRHAQVDGVFKDSWVMSLMRDEWRPGEGV